MQGKICIVTGANAGIGAYIVQGLAEKGATVVLGCRNLTKAKNCIQQIVSRTSLEPKYFFPLQLDVSSQKSIKTFVTEFKSKFNHLHVLVNNAAIGGTETKQLSEDGLELTFATNVMGYFLLTNLLLDTLESSSPSRIVNVASGYTGDLVLDDLNFDKRKYSGNAAYRQSKQANIMFTWELNRRLREKKSKISVNSCTPGIVATKLLSDLGFGGGKSPDQGASTPLFLAMDPSIDKESGLFWTSPGVKSATRYDDPKANAELWRICDSYLKH
eukprot:TRINITY_DN1240_c0_g1_i1.p1 TRINITY_DN1240_c0_g1~~TRINITY_DN1240_c0_g1_i1.p1  ORF type:complete len:272 (-),score=34.99 TRINITY_DN1240_c0_g1_i1:39-854(-)